jgi:hypothetical protein
MGWTSFNDYPHQSRAEIIRREFTQAATEANPNAWGFEQIAERGATVYAIMYRDTPDQPRAFYGMVFLTQRKEGEFYYKEMGEECGPYQYEMPARMLAQLEQLAPNPAGPYAEKWREKVRQHHANKNAKAKAKREARATLARFISSHFQVIHIGGTSCAR